MVVDKDHVTFTLPKTALGDVLRLTTELTDRMHLLLERNTDGALSPTERSELQTLVQMAQFGQIVSMAIQHQSAGQP